jgi:iron complex outermembrane receptor protein
VTIRETRWGSANYAQYYGNPFVILEKRIIPAYLTDISVSYAITDSVKLTVGGANIFDAMPPYMPRQLRSVRNGPAYLLATPYGEEGAYFYGRVTITY